jgi:hypothetical protein
VRTQLAYKFANRTLLYLTTVKPDARDVVTPDTEKPKQRERPRIVREAESEEGSRGPKRARQSTLSFVVPDDSRAEE